MRGRWLWLWWCCWGEEKGDGGREEAFGPLGLGGSASASGNRRKSSSASGLVSASEWRLRCRRGCGCALLRVNDRRGNDRRVNVRGLME